MAINAVITSAVHTEEEWLQSDPVVYKDVVVYTSDKNNQYKIGDGTSKWSELPYSGGSGGGGMNVILSEEKPEGSCLWCEKVNV